MSLFEITLIMAVDDNGKPQSRENEVLNYIKNGGGRVVRTNDLGSVSLVQSHLKKLHRILIDFGPFDVVHSNMDKFNGLNLWVAKKLHIPKRISHSHCANRVRYSNRLKDILASVYQKLMLKIIQDVSTDFVGCSELANAYLHGGKGEIVINGIDLSLYYNHPGLSKIPFQSRNKVLGVVARISPQKNPSYFIAIVRELLKIRQDFTLVWAGDGDSKVLKKEIENEELSPFFNFLGHRTDVADILQAVDVFLMPSFFEGLPISAVEAQVSGCECILSDTITRMVDIGKCTYLPIGMGNEVHWAHKINELLDKPRTRPNFENIKNFDVQTMADKMARIYTK